MSAHYRLTRTSSDLRALAAPLAPPSPTLIVGDFLGTSGSGEIPLLLDLSSDVFTSAPTSPWSLELDVEYTEGVLHGSASFNTIDTVGTFGPIKRSEGLRDFGRSSPVMERAYVSSIQNANEAITDEVFFTPKSSVSFLSLSSGRTPPTPHDVSPSRRNLHTRSRAVSGSPSSPSPSRAILGTTNKHARNVDTIMRPPSPPIIRDSKHLKLSPIITNEIHRVGASQTYSTLSTACFAPPSPSPSVDLLSPLSSTQVRRLRRPLERTGAIHQRSTGVRNNHADRSSRSPENSPGSLEASSVTSPSPAPWNTEGLSSVVSVRSSSTITRTNSEISQDASPYSKFAFLPKDLAWLKDVTIELWIDQEGFRAIKPTLRLMGYSPRARSLHPYGTVHASGTDLTAGVAEFMPVKREAFAFHHAVLDGTPTLRRVTVDGDESRDYISRHASLNIKSSGVYTVLGTETTSLAIAGVDTRGRGGSRFDHIKLQWKFDYLVDDRRVDGNGKAMQGEKTLTPLTFSCSPLLLHPLQGKKVGLMHVVKKSVATKLAAEKLEPPRRPRPKDVQLHPGYKTPSPRNMGSHSRSRSDAHAKESAAVLRSTATNSTLVPGGRMGTLGITEQVQYTRRRRASSAGEHGWATAATLVQANPHRTAIAKHIMPHAELSRLITSNAYEDEADQQHSGLTVLSPPRYRFPLRMQVET
ncbi:hypothetical protein BJ138DRAFT_474983 [Hygrophoropsis aurantiaca]|uniref:Uncharacterized protein n=1 Tax=Hygrophoropsis aurantiaca TaxID=72124 RepID=A0ACB8ASY9_9AGAM|nr:hypothetical protein BJ138DRAFT_474983 [Hygrophoropsis aurantiaca]